MGIDARGTDRQERIDGRQSIELLRVEFQSNGARLDTVAGQHRESLDSGYTLLSLMDATAEGGAPMVPPELLYEFIEVWTYDPVSGGLNALINSGRLGILQG